MRQLYTVHLSVLVHIITVHGAITRPSALCVWVWIRQTRQSAVAMLISTSLSPVLVIIYCSAMKVKGIAS